MNSNGSNGRRPGMMRTMFRVPGAGPEEKRHQGLGGAGLI
jgi:hypothetical protein